jgi:hypothetical protein
MWVCREMKWSVAYLIKVEPVSEVNIVAFLQTMRAANATTVADDLSLALTTQTKVTVEKLTLAFLRQGLPPMLQDIVITVQTTRIHRPRAQVGTCLKLNPFQT